MDFVQPPFVFAGRRLIDDASGVELEFRLGSDTFTERFTFDFDATGGVASDDPMIERLLDVVMVCVGVSYYKLTMPGRIHSDVPLHRETAALVPHLYDHGLRELAVRNGLAVPSTVELTSAERATTPNEHSAARSNESIGSRVLLPFGGGKDSTLTLSLLDNVTALAIHATDVQRRVAAAAGIELLEVRRALDPLLAVRTAEGGLNGHIPITAINSSVTVLVAALCGFDEVVMANERSAEEPTMLVDGHIPVNHQYSKTFAFEQMLAAAVAPSGVRYFSLVRRWSELAIAGALAPDTTLRTRILSCNRAFSLTRPQVDPTWCLDCAKCRFTFLSFAVFLTPTEAIDMFGGNPLDDPDQVDGFRALWADKPFDCVGELAESALAMAYLGTVPAWRSTTVVSALADEATVVGAASGTTLEALLEPAGDDAVPEHYRARLHNALPRLGATG